MDMNIIVMTTQHVQGSRNKSFVNFMLGSRGKMKDAYRREAGLMSERNTFSAGQW